MHLVADAALGIPWAAAAWPTAGWLYPRLAPAGASPRRAFAALVRRTGLPALAAVAVLLLARMLASGPGR